MDNTILELKRSGLVCKVDDCLADAGQSGFCRAHRRDTTCVQCNHELYEHHSVQNKDGDTFFVCPTACYEERG